ncbi:hypothetical protein BDQ12DRAFT_221196 [Crucibulum laeve]|uniref:Acetyl-CoA synthetase-like protein n=1 Tax=Crucibulum laeve TaxID=68775 RepID=A0A5C3LVE5_9AGAR|nr:hypothetical protein BDQ12DRAFT_221196 [Crucibulum laeve]
MTTTSFITLQATTSTTFTPPPLDGSLSLPEIFDYHASQSPHHPLFVYEENGLVEVITWSHAVRAIHTAARYIDRFLSPDGTHNRSTVIAILANTDTFTYFVLIVGILRAGFQAFPISPRNSPAGIAHLLHATHATHIIMSHDPGIQRLASAACAQRKASGMAAPPVQAIPLPTFEYLFGGSEEDFEPLPPMVPPLPTDPSLILHSSGSMSFPKPVAMAYRNLFVFGLAPYYGERDLCGQIFSCHALPMYHAIGCVMLPLTMLTGLIMSSFSPNDTPIFPTPERVFAGAVASRSTFIFCVPSFIEAWSRDPDRMDELKKFTAVIFAGAPMHRESGNRMVAEGVKLIPFYGSTEVGPAVAFVPHSPCKEGWEYFRFSPHCRPILVPYDENMFQVLFLECPTHTPNVLNVDYKGMRAFDSRDLVERHPTNPDLWRIFGRCDEQIIHSTGEKTNPLPIEKMLLKHPKIRNAVLFGRGRFHAGVLIQPTPENEIDPTDTVCLARYRNDIWPLVEQANERSPSHSRLFKEMILVTCSHKPFELTSKGTPQKSSILEAYQAEIEQAYAAVEESSQTDLQSPDTWEHDQCIFFVRTAVERVMKGRLSDDDDIFQAGCDSLKATWIRNTILHTLRHSAKVSTRKIPQNFVYFNPTIRRLGTYVAHVVLYGQGSMAVLMSSQKTSEMERLARLYSTDFPIHCPSSPNPISEGDVVLLTGSTGFLGSYTLESLVKDPTVLRIYAFNRRDVHGDRDSFTRHETTFLEHRIDLDILRSKKIVLLEGDLTSDHLGLGERAYKTLQLEVTCIMHNAWHVNFNVSLSSLEPLIIGTRRLIDFALGSPFVQPPRILFVSSLGIFMNWTGGPSSPEEPNCRAATAIGSGYSESKWVAERILAQAAATTPLRPVIVRVGHLCGGHKGSWNRVEWLPILVRSGVILKCIPSPVGEITWIPVHVAAGSLVEMRNSNDQFMNLRHPHPVPSTFVFSTIAELLRVPLVGYIEWLNRLEASRPDSTSRSKDLTMAATDDPAIILLDFFRYAYRPISLNNVDQEAFAFPSAAIEKALSAAPLHLANAPPLTKADVASWIRYWQDIKFLPA